MLFESMQPSHMPDASNKNPVEQRLEYLEGLWNDFSKDREARLLRWLVDDDGVRMVELLFEIQNEEIGQIPDLFIRLDVPFTSAQPYAYDLLRGLQAQYEVSRQEIGEEGMPNDWRVPALQQGEDTLLAFVRACSSFRQYYHGKMLTLAVFLAPSRIESPVAWHEFLKGLVRCDIPPTVRFTVIDRLHQPMLGELAEAEPKLVHTVTPDLDMPGALEEIADMAEGVGPGNDFRKLFVRLGNLAQKGNIRAANKVAVSALRIARKQQWFDLQTAVYMVLGATYLRAKEPVLALKAYRYANRAANASEKAGNPAGGKLIVQTRFAEAAALLAQGNYAEAGPLYEQTVPLAQAQGDGILEVEAWRMASYCYEMIERPSDAWRCGQLALDAGQDLPDELRPNATLPFVGQRLLGLLARYERDPKYEREVRARMTTLVGEDWEKKLPA